MSAALRLAQRISIDAKTGASVGLGGLDCAKCSARSKVARGCRLPGYNFTRKTPIRIDYHKPSRPALDFALFCPASIPGIFDTQADAYQLIQIRDQGGLHLHFGKPQAELPEALLNVASLAYAASERLASEVSDAYAAQGQQ